MTTVADKESKMYQ